LLPVTLGVLWLVSGSNLAAFSVVARAVPPLLLVSVGLGAASLARALGASKAAAAAAFALAAANPLLWFEIAWGGLGQLASIALVLGALGAFLSRRPRVSVSASLFALAGLANPYPLFFGGVFLLVVLLAHPDRRPTRQSWMVALPAILASAAILLLVYVPLLAMEKTGMPLAEIAPAVLTGGVVPQALIYGGLLVALIMALALAFVFPILPSRVTWLVAAAAIAAVSFAIESATPLNLLLRSFYFLAALAPVPTVLGLASGRPALLFRNHRFSFRLPFGAAVVVLLLVAAFLLQTAEAAVPGNVAYYEVTDPDLPAMANFLSHESPGGVVVLTPQVVPDSWWLSGLTTRSAYAPGPPTSYTNDPGLREARAALLFATGRAAIESDPIAVTASVCDASGIVVWYLGAFTNLPLATVHEADVRLLAPNGTPLAIGPWNATLDGPALRLAADAVANGSTIGQVTISLSAQGDAAIEGVAADGPGIGQLNVAEWAPPGGAWSFGGTATNASGHAVGAAGESIPFALAASSNGSLSATWDPARHWALFSASGQHPSLTISMHAGPAGLRTGGPAAAAQPRSTDDLLYALGARYVLTNGLPDTLRARLAADPGLRPLTRSGETQLLSLTPADGALACARARFP
jgi:hypothetical protein